MPRKKGIHKTPEELKQDVEKRRRRAAKELGITPPERNGDPTEPAASPKYLYGDEVQTSDVRWLWAGFVPQGMPTLVYGPSLSGKSTVMSALAAAVTAGRAPTGQGTLPPSRVIWLAGEEPIEQVVIPRLRAAGANLACVLFPQLWSDGTRRGWRLLEQGADFIALCKKTKAALVVIDPLACFLGGDLPTESNAAARAAFGFLTSLGCETGAASLGCKHPRKSGRGSAQEQMSGGLEWFNTPRSVLLVGPHPSKADHRVCLQQKPSLSSKGAGMEFIIDEHEGSGVALFTSESNVRAQDVLSEELGVVERSMLDEAKDFLHHHLDETEKRTTDLQRYAQESGIAWMTVRRAKGELGVTNSWRTEDGKKFVVWLRPEGGFSK